jgi:hypothetical protein
MSDLQQPFQLKYMAKKWSKLLLRNLPTKKKNYECTQLSLVGCVNSIAAKAKNPIFIGIQYLL